ncbi:hypothetical protein ABZ924_36100 [Streptomyces sp. NPDC046876]|uniref:hypothetical protein n=1 Tax=Streptomyces sp. NPDC046876 TaxID=3155616 RepID=UPI0033F76BCE
MGWLPTTLQWCRLCAADEDTGEARSVTVTRDGLMVVWHMADCLHYRADRVLAGRED